MVCCLECPKRQPGSQMVEVAEEHESLTRFSSGFCPAAPATGQACAGKGMLRAILAP